LKEFAKTMGRDLEGFAPDALAALEHYDWPGNVRELRNAVERAVALSCGAVVELEDLPDAIRDAAPEVGSLSEEPGEDELVAVPAGAAPGLAIYSTVGTLSQTKEEAEAGRIRAALDRHENNRRRAAQELGISRMTLYKKLHRYGLLVATA